MCTIRVYCAIVLIFSSYYYLIQLLPLRQQRQEKHAKNPKEISPYL